ncbi:MULTISPECIES: hypothetical protein [Hymenobacter]
MLLSTFVRSSGLLLACSLLSSATVSAQTAVPVPATTQHVAPASLYFLDGLPSDQQTISQLNPRTIASATVIKGEEAIRIFGAGAQDGVVMVLTKRNVRSAAVAEFNRRYDIRPVEAPTPPAVPTKP